VIVARDFRALTGVFVRSTETCFAAAQAESM
jgi:hypothetical protein